MASVQLRGKSYACIFCWHGKRQWFTIGKVTEQEAKAKASQVEYVLMRLKQRLLDLPPGIDITEFVQHDGKPPTGHPNPSDGSKGLTLRDFCDRYLSTNRESLENRTVDGIELHFKHLCLALGDRFPIGKLNTTALSLAPFAAGQASELDAHIA